MIQKYFNIYFWQLGGALVFMYIFAAFYAYFYFFIRPEYLKKGVPDVPRSHGYLAWLCVFYVLMVTIYVLYRITFFS